MSRFVLFFTGWILLAFPVPVFAYIGPGAGFAIAGSFFVMLTAMLSAVIALLTWPVRGIIRAVRYRKVYARSRFKKVIILGFDGMDYKLTRQWMAEGKLPNFSRLREQGSFAPLRSTIPPISPVAWSAFQTGSNPGKTNIFDFLTRDPRTYDIKLSSVDITPPSRKLGFGKYAIPVERGDIRLLRKSTPFWKSLGDKGIFSSIIRVPITFPPEKFNGVQLSGMCAPDIRGTQGTFSFYTTRDVTDRDKTGGEIYRVKVVDDTVKAELIGPFNPILKVRKPLTCKFQLRVDTADTATLAINRKRISLRRGVYSEWTPVRFKAAPGFSVSGICQFLLTEASPDISLYVSPIHIDPEKPAMPISHPPVYATYISKRQGYYGTLGLAEDSWALNENVISDQDFYQQCLQGDVEREKMFFDTLNNINRGLCVCVFDGTDRVQHGFWREMDHQHPVHGGAYRKPEESSIEAIYRHADAVLGRTIKTFNGSDTLLMVISDHGFNTFRYGIDLNRWLEENGYLKLKNGDRSAKNLKNIDWSQTRAFAIGLSGLFVNLKGREAHGIVDPKTEAPALRNEIAAKLSHLRDPLRNQSAIKTVYNAWQTYKGPYLSNAPDLIVGYQTGYRASWETAVGKTTDQIFHDNIKAWSGDHCIDQSLVPGVLFCNHKIEETGPRLLDIAPTVLTVFGVDIPAHMDGKALTVTCPEEGESGD